MKAASFIRGSARRQDSLDWQRRHVAAYAREHGLDLVAQYRDVAELLRDAAGPGRAWDAVVVDRLDRFARRGRDVKADVLQPLQRAGVPVHASDRPQHPAVRQLFVVLQVVQHLAEQLGDDVAEHQCDEDPDSVAPCRLCTHAQQAERIGTLAVLAFEEVAGTLYREEELAALVPQVLDHLQQLLAPQLGDVEPAAVVVGKP